MDCSSTARWGLAVIRGPCSRAAPRGWSASIVGDVRVFGRIDYIEVWNEERFASKLHREPWTDEDGLKLSEHGI